MDEKIKNQINDLLKKLKCEYDEVSSMAWDNRPDFDEEYLEEYEGNLSDSEKNFTIAFEQLAVLVSNA